MPKVKKTRDWLSEKPTPPKKKTAAQVFAAFKEFDKQFKKGSGSLVNANLTHAEKVILLGFDNANTPELFQVCASARAYLEMTRCARKSRNVDDAIQAAYLLGRDVEEIRARINFPRKKGGVDYFTLLDEASVKTKEERSDAIWAAVPLKHFPKSAQTRANVFTAWKKFNEARRCFGV